MEPKTNSPRYATKLARDRNTAYVRKYYYTSGGRERKQIEYYFGRYPELQDRKCYEETDDLATRISKIKTETAIIKLERKLKISSFTLTSEEDSS
jgi:hypothetical protein